MENQLLLALQNNKLLKNVDNSKINLQNIRGKLITINEGEILYREGDTADSIFLIVSGELNLVRKKLLGKTRSLILGENEFIGSDEFFDETARTSTSIALKDSYLIELSDFEVNQLIQQDASVYENLRETSHDDVGGAKIAIINDPVVEGKSSNIQPVIEEHAPPVLDDPLDKPELHDQLKDENTFVKSRPEEEGQHQITKDELDVDVFKALESLEQPGSFTADENVNMDQFLKDMSVEDSAFFAGLNDDTSAPVTAENTNSVSTIDDNPVDDVKGDPFKEVEMDSSEDADPFRGLEMDPVTDEAVDPFRGLEMDPVTDDAASQFEDIAKEKIDPILDANPETEPPTDEVNELSQEIDVPSIPDIVKDSNSKNLEDDNMTADQLELINKAAQLVNSNIQIDDVLKNIVDVATNITNADRGTLYLVDKENNELWSKVAMGNEMKEIRLKIGEGISGWVAESGEVVNIEDVKSDERFKSDFDKSSGYVTKNMVCFPIKNKKEEVVGVIQLLNSSLGKFSQLDHKFLDALSIHAALALENAGLVEKLLHGERVSSLGKMANFLIQDIKKPILVSKRYAEHLKTKSLPPEIAQVLDMMLEQLNQVADLVQTTSSYSEGKRILHTLTVNFMETMEDFSQRMASYVQTRSCEIINNVDANINVKLDVKEFYQCYMHIVRNACDAMPDGGRIVIYSSVAANKLTLAFKDDGLGIPESIKDKIFEPFTSHGKKEGTGLGLSITKQIVEAHGGTIDVESNLGEGATIIISLPV